MSEFDQSIELFTLIDVYMTTSVKIVGDFIISELAMKRDGYRYRYYSEHGRCYTFRPGAGHYCAPFRTLLCTFHFTNIVTDIVTTTSMVGATHFGRGLDISPRLDLSKHFNLISTVRCSIPTTTRRYPIQSNPSPTYSFECSLPFNGKPDRSKSIQINPDESK